MAEREIYFVAKLAADFGAGDVGSAKECEGNARAVVKRIGAACERL